MDKDVVCIYIYIYKVKYYSAIKKNEIMPLAAMWMDLEIVILSEVNQTNRNTIWHILYVESKIWHEHIYETETDSDIENRFEVPQSQGGREGNGTPLQYSCLENPMAAVHGVTKSRTRLSDFTFTLHFHALEKEMATHSSVLAWRIPGTMEPGGPRSMGSHRVGHD